MQLRLQVAGALLLAVSAAIHLDLYVTGYRSIPTVGWLFLLQVIVAFVLTAAVLVTHSSLAAAASAGFALSTLGAYLLAVWIGLFGFKEIRTRVGIAAGLIEVAAFGVLALAAIAIGPPVQADGSFSRTARMVGQVQAALSRVIGVVGAIAFMGVLRVLLCAGRGRGLAVVWLSPGGRVFVRCSLLLAREMLLQIALQDIGQLTDIEAQLSPRAGGSRHGPARTSA